MKLDRDTAELIAKVLGFLLAMWIVLDRPKFWISKVRRRYPATNQKVVVRCQMCGQRYRVSANRLGAETKCKQCGERFTVQLEPKSENEKRLRHS